MIQTLELDEVWDRLNDAFLGVYEEVLRNTATVRWQVHHSDNSYFLLRATASFQRVGCPDEEDLVLSVDIHRDGDLITWTTDAGQSAGVVLAEAPSRTHSADGPLGPWLGASVDEAIAWFTAETPNFIAYLNREPTPYDVD